MAALDYFISGAAVKKANAGEIPRIACRHGSRAQTRSDAHRWLRGVVGAIARTEITRRSATAAFSLDVDVDVDDQRGGGRRRTTSTPPSTSTWPPALIDVATLAESRAINVIVIVIVEDQVETDARRGAGIEPHGDRLTAIRDDDGRNPAGVAHALDVRRIGRRISRVRTRRAVAMSRIARHPAET